LDGVSFLNMRIQAFPSMKLSDDMVVTAIPSMTGRAALQGLLHVAWVGAGAMKSMREAEVLEVVD
jgi:hypothetical protein